MRIRWTKKEDAILLREVESTKDKLSKADCFRHVSTLLKGREPNSISLRYYKLVKQQKVVVKRTDLSKKERMTSEEVTSYKMITVRESIPVYINNIKFQFASNRVMVDGKVIEW